ncbi:MAG: hypothetical protein OXC30_03625 [Alphaproteobacteria bacterium]|nr:hypothetical protein [Alphaproteobacteria bacterium]
MRTILTTFLIGIFCSNLVFGRAVEKACAPAAAKISATVEYNGKRIDVPYDRVIETLMGSEKLSGQPFEVGYAIALEQLCLDIIIREAVRPELSTLQATSKFKESLRKMEEDLTRSHFLQGRVSAKATDDAVGEEYNSLKASFEKNNKYVYHLSLIVVDSLEKAGKVRSLLKSGNDFENLARMHCLEKDLREKAGRVDTPIPDGQMVDGMRTMVESLVDGGHSSDFVQSGPHYVFVKRRLREKAVMPPLTKIRKEVVSALESRVLPQVLLDIVGPAKIKGFDPTGKDLPINLKSDLNKAIQQQKEQKAKG